jgi:hypothetical protein
VSPPRSLRTINSGYIRTTIINQDPLWSSAAAPAHAAALGETSANWAEARMVH